MDANLDRVNFGATLVIILLVSIPLILSPESGAALVQQSYDFVASQFGWLYQLAGLSALGLLLWLAFGRFGQVKLGLAEDQPEFSTYSWVAMLFCAGHRCRPYVLVCHRVGLTITSHLLLVPSLNPSRQRVGPPVLRRVFHWGFIAWAFYCLPTLGYRLPVLRPAGTGFEVQRCLSLLAAGA